MSKTFEVVVENIDVPEKVPGNDVVVVVEDDRIERAAIIAGTIGAGNRKANRVIKKIGKKKESIL